MELRRQPGSERSFSIKGEQVSGVPPNRPPKAWVSSTAMSHVVHETVVILTVTSSKDANTGPTLGSVIAAALMYRLCMRRLISWDCSPEISSAFPAPLRLAQFPASASPPSVKPLPAP